MTDINELLKDHQLYHSDFQMDRFITMRSGGTEYGQYKQALRELDKRRRGLKELYVEKALLKLEINKLNFPIIRHFKKNKINNGKKIMAMEDLDKNIFDTEREFKRFYSQAECLKVKIGELTPEKKEQLEIEMWEFKIKELCLLDQVSTGKVSKNTYELIGVCPPNIRKELLGFTNPANLNKLGEWYDAQYQEEYEIIQLPDIPIRKLLEG